MDGLGFENIFGGFTEYFRQDKRVKLKILILCSFSSFNVNNNLPLELISLYCFLNHLR